MSTAVESPNALQRATDDPLPWQGRLLPFMVGSLIVLAIFFLATTLWLFVDLERRLDYTAPDLISLIQNLPASGDVAADREYAQWYARVVLEKTALEQRFSMQKIVVKARMWTRFMGFLTGMILCFCGCVFVLGKLREPLEASGEGSGVKVFLRTSSPGVFLAFAGTVLISLSLSLPASVASTDASVYLPQQVQLVPDSNEATAPRDAPPGMAPAKQQDGETPHGVPPLPDSVRRQMEQEHQSSQK
jgi:hypothetical protein